MQTSQLLSPEETGIIKKIYRAKAANVNTAFVLGYMLIFMGIFFSIIKIKLHVKDSFFLVVIFFVSIMGLLSLLSGIHARKKNKRLFKTALDGNKKEVITEYLKQVEIIKGNMLRYHFTGFSKDVSLAIRPLGKSTIIEPLQTLTNVMAELHFVSISPDENVLLKVLYDQPVNTTETIAPLTAEDKNKLMPWSAPEYRVLLLVVLIVSGIMILVAGFDALASLITICIAALIVLCFFIPRIVLLKMHRNKILITTIITESLHVHVRAGKYSSRQTWYRIGNGLVEEYLTPDLQVGDIVHLSFIEKRNGSKGLLIDVTKK